MTRWKRVCADPPFRAVGAASLDRGGCVEAIRWHLNADGSQGVVVLAGNGLTQRHRVDPCLGLAAISSGDEAAVFGHNGATPGYSATTGIDPSTSDAIVVLTNSDSLSADRLAQQILLSIDGPAESR